MNDSNTFPNQQPARDHYGDPLPPGAVARMGSVRWRHGGWAEEIHVSHDGQVIISGHGDLMFWERATGKRLRRLGASGSNFVFSGDDAFFAFDTWDEGAVVSVWDTAKGKETCHTKKQQALVALSADAKTLVTIALPGGSAAPDPGFYFWHVPSGKQRKHVPITVLPERPFAVSPDQTLLAGRGPKETVRLLELATGREVASLAHGADVTALAFSPDASTLASAGKDKRVRLWMLATGRELHQWELSSDQIRALGFSPDGKLLACGGQDNLHIWETATGKERNELKVNGHWVNALAFLPGAKTLVTAGDGPVQLWDVATAKQLNADAAPRDAIRFVAFSPDNRLLLTAVCDGTVRVWESATGKELRRLSPGGAYPFAFALSPNGKLFAWSAKEENVVRLWDVSAGQEVLQLKHYSFPAGEVAFSPDGKNLATASRGALVYLWDLGTGKEVRQFHGADSPESLAFSPDGKTLALTPANLWDVETGKRLSGPRWCQGGLIAFPATGRRLAYVGAKGPHLWDMATGRDIAEISVDHHVGYSMALAPDAKMIAAAERPQWTPKLVTLLEGDPIGLYEVLTGKKRRQFVGHSWLVLKIAFSPDGKLLASAGGDGTALVWDPRAIFRLREQANPALSQGQLESMWKNLAGDDVPKAYDSVTTLIQVPDQAVSFFRDHLKPGPADQSSRIARLIADLNDDDFQVRENASKALAKLGRTAVRPLRRALLTPSGPESRQRLQELLARPEILGACDPAPEEMRTSRSVEVLEWIATPGARHLLQELAKGPSDAQLAKEAKASLERIAAKPAQ